MKTVFKTKRVEWVNNLKGLLSVELEDIPVILMCDQLM